MELGEQDISTLFFVKFGQPESEVRKKLEKNLENRHLRYKFHQV